MSERIQDQNEPAADVIMLPTQNVELMDEAQVIEIFLASLRHPGAPKDRQTLADTIIKYTGNSDDINADDPHRVFEQRVREINMSTAVPSNSRWDELVDSSSDEFDQMFLNITSALQKMKGNESTVREALFILLDTRITCLRLGMKDDTTFEQVVTFLIPNDDA